MLWLFAVLAVFAIIFAGLLYAWKMEIYLVQVLLIQNLLIFIVVNPYYGASIFFPVLNLLAGRAIYLYNIALLISRAHTFLTMMYLHGGVMHVFGNLIILFFIGMALEERVGKKWTFIFYFISGFAATLGQYTFNWLQFAIGASGFGILTIPNIGASGAVFGIMGSLVFLYPRDKITMLLGPILMPNVRVDLAVGVFILMQTGIALLSSGVTNVAHAAHFSGLAAGIVLAYYAKKQGVIERKKGPKRDYAKLKKLVKNDEQKELYKKIIESDERDVAEAWSEHLIEKSSCPRCGRDLNDSECECGFDVWED
ncbi:MAG: rhomboid family intramembrane serine protease [Candidatus Thermoplasmatota archaeon]